jgi:hypothetical protein
LEPFLAECFHVLLSFQPLFGLRRSVLFSLIIAIVHHQQAWTGTCATGFSIRLACMLLFLSGNPVNTLIHHEPGVFLP